MVPTESQLCAVPSNLWVSIIVITSILQMGKLSSPKDQNEKQKSWWPKPRPCVQGSAGRGTWVESGLWQGDRGSEEPGQSRAPTSWQTQSSAPTCTAGRGGAGLAQWLCTSPKETPEKPGKAALTAKPPRGAEMKHFRCRSQPGTSRDVCRALSSRSLCSASLPVVI